MAKNSSKATVARARGAGHKQAHLVANGKRQRNPLQRWRHAVNALDRVRWHCRKLNAKRPPHMEDVSEFIRRVYQAVGMEW